LYDEYNISDASDAAIDASIVIGFDFLCLVVAVFLGFSFHDERNNDDDGNYGDKKNE
jgi:hypothetical protein